MPSKNPLRKAQSEFFLLHVLPFLVSLFFSASAFLNFHSIFYFSPQSRQNVSLATSFLFSPRAFFLTFYSFFVIFVIGEWVILFATNFYAKVASFILTLISAVLMAYTAGHLLTIKIFIYLAFLSSVVYGYSRPFHLLLGAGSATFFIFIETLPNRLPVTESWMQSSDFATENTLFVVMLLTLLISYTVRRISRKFLFAAETISHQNLVMNQMTELNNKLQQYAKAHGEEAVQNERMRITRDMHDSCGYAFVNITAIIDAIMSNPELERDKLSETLLTVRNLASTGLKETRKTLRQIREVESPSQSNLTAIYEIKRIFMQITGINVDIQSGNLKENYGITINAIIMHTLQEGLTNAIRHGRAKNIFVSFWDDVSLLTMVIKDDGVGSKEVVKGIGLSGMEERLSRVLGKLAVSTPKEGGFRLEIQIPLVDIGADELQM